MKDRACAFQALGDLAGALQSVSRTSDLQPFLQRIHEQVSCCWTHYAACNFALPAASAQHVHLASMWPPACSCTLGCLACNTAWFVQSTKAL